MRKHHLLTAVFAAVVLAVLFSVTAVADVWTQRAFEPELTEAQAQEIAMNHAGINADAVDFVRTELDFDDGRLKYDLDIYSDRTKYDYDIDAKTGEILAFSREIRYTGFKPKSGLVGEVQPETAAAASAGQTGTAEQTAASTVTAQAETAAQTETAAAQAETAANEAASSRITYPAESVVYADGITSQEALMIALKHAGVKEDDISRPKVGMDYEHGRKIYEIGFYVGWTEYDYDIDVDTGEIVKYSIEVDD